MLVDVFIQAEDGQTRQERVEGGSQVTVGRHTQCTIVLESDLVSRHHATLMFGLEAFRVEDTSSNGTVVGDVVLRREALDVPYGTPLVVGSHTMQIFPALAGVSVEVSAVRSGAHAPPSSNRPAGGSSRPAPGPTPPPPRPTRVPVTNGAGRITGELPPRPPGGVTPVATVQSQALAPPRVPRVAKENGAPEVAARPSSPRDTVEDGGFHAEAAPTAPGHKDVFDLRREVHRRLRDSAELAQLESRSGSHDATARARVHAAIRRMVRAFEGRLPPGHDVELLATELTSEAVGLGPLEELLADPTVRAIVVDDAASVFVEREGAPLLPTSARFTDTERVRLCLERLLTHAHAPAPVAHRPLVDVRLADGTRLSALLPPLARRGVSFSLRRPPPKAPTLEALAERGVLSVQVARFLARVVLAQKNIVVTGPALSGKTQVTSALAAAAPLEERFVVFEGDEAIVLPQRHVVAVEATPVFAAGALGVSARATFAAALRLRPQRVVAAAVPGGAALDVLQAMSAGTCPWILEVAGRSPREALARLETQALLRAPEMPSRPLRDLLAAGAQVVVHVGRAAAGRSAVVSVSEVVGTRDEVGFTLTPIFEAKAPGEPLKATGHIPGFLEDFVTAGLVRDGEPPL